jgi:hypothetical protein
MESKTRGTVFWLVIFVGGAVFQLWRGSPVDTIIYLVVALLVFFSSQHRIQIPAFKETRFSSAAFLLLVAMLVFIFLPIHSWIVSIIYLILVPFLFRIIWQQDLPVLHKPNSALRRSSKTWVTIGLLTCVCELGNYFASDFTHNDKAYPTITVLLDPVVADTWGKVIFVIIWAGIGIGILRVSTQR